MNKHMKNFLDELLKNEKVEKRYIDEIYNTIKDESNQQWILPIFCKNFVLEKNRITEKIDKLFIIVNYHLILENKNPIDKVITKKTQDSGLSLVILKLF